MREKTGECAYNGECDYREPKEERIVSDDIIDGFNPDKKHEQDILSGKEPAKRTISVTDAAREFVEIKTYFTFKQIREIVSTLLKEIETLERENAELHLEAVVNEEIEKREIIMTKDELIEKDWVEVEPNKWMRKYGFIDMADGSNYCTFNDAVILQKVVDGWGED